VIEAGLKCVQGKPVVISISMKEGEAKFIHEATIARRHGAAVVVMAFDEVGQARYVRAQDRNLQRAYDILVGQLNFPPEDIISTPTFSRSPPGSRSTNNYGVDFIEATALDPPDLPHAAYFRRRLNLSFSFRGNEPVREAMHSCVPVSRDKGRHGYGHRQCGQMIVYDDIDPELRRCAKTSFSTATRAPPSRLLRWPKFRARRSRPGTGSRLGEWPVASG